MAHSIQQGVTTSALFLLCLRAVQRGNFLPFAVAEAGEKNEQVAGRTNLYVIPKLLRYYIRCLGWPRTLTPRLTQHCFVDKSPRQPPPPTGKHSVALSTFFAETPGIQGQKAARSFPLKPRLLVAVSGGAKRTQPGRYVLSSGVVELSTSWSTGRSRGSLYTANFFTPQ